MEGTRRTTATSMKHLGLRLNDIPEYILSAIIVLLPLQTRWITIPGTLNGMHWEYGTLSIYAFDILAAFFVATTISAYLSEKTIIPLQLSHAVAFFLLLVAFLSTDFAGNKLSALFWFAKLAEGIILFFCITQTRMRGLRAAWAFVIAALLQSGLAIWQFTTQHVFRSTLLGMSAQDPQTLGVQVVETIAGRTLRAYGSFPHPNMLAGLLVVSILVSVVVACSTRILWQRILLCVAVIVQSYALMTTFSRQGWIALIIAMGIFGAFSFIRERTFPAVIPLACACVIIPMLVFSTQHVDLIRTRTSTEARLEQKSIDERQTYIEQGMDVLRDHWFAGVGIGNDTAYLQAQDRKNNLYKAGTSYQPVHNIYMLIFVELGIFGLVAFIFFILSLFFHSQWKSPTVVIWSLAIIALAIVGVFDHYLWSLHSGIMLFWIVAGLLARARQQESVENPVLTR